MARLVKKVDGGNGENLKIITLDFNQYLICPFLILFRQRHQSTKYWLL